VWLCGELLALCDKRGQLECGEETEGFQMLLEVADRRLRHYMQTNTLKRVELSANIQPRETDDVV